MKRFFRSRFLKVLVCLGILGLVVAVGIVEPRGSVGYLVFRSAYSLPSTRPALLRFYTWNLREFEGGYLPPSIDQFLINRLGYCKGGPEETAIIDFQIRQSSARWGDAASLSHEECQRQIIANIMGRLSEMSDENAVSAMVFIESLRRQDVLGKGGFVYMWNYVDEVAVLNRSAFDLAKKRFELWWGDGSNWPEIRSEDPLSGTDLAIGAGP